ncbi:MAG: ABC transporter substrate-binding protein [bacterium]|nr:ABC transporter substrate-binding protein [bacterium]
MSKTAFRWLALAALMATLSACGGDTDSVSAPGNDPVPSGAPQRIISFAPNITEVVFALGAGDRVIGVTSFCDYPPEATELPKVGGHMDPDYEAITMLRPDLIILQGQHEKMAGFVKDNNIPVVHVDMDSLATIDDGIAVLGEALGAVDKATALRSQIQADLEAVRAAVKPFPRKQVFLCTWRQGLTQIGTVGGESFLSELAAVAGGDNIYADSAETYPQASKETIVLKAPEAIVEFYPGKDLSDKDKATLAKDWAQFASLSAVQTKQIHFVTESYAMIPGLRVTRLARLMAAVLHPEADVAAP